MASCGMEVVFDQSGKTVQFLVHPQIPIHSKPARGCTAREGKNLDVVGALLKTQVCDQQSQNPKHGMMWGYCKPLVP